MLKRIIAIILGAVLMMNVAACVKPDDGGKKDPPSWQEGEKKTLVFQVDEGVGGYEFIAGYGYSKESLDSVLNHVLEGLGALREKYNLCIQIYPIYYYKEEGWGGNVSDPMNKWSPNFLYSMDFFKANNINVYLELMSSGVYTNQNGELGLQPIVDIFNGIEGKARREVKGISMDMASMTALKKAYGATFEGVRFHELQGTNALGEMGDPHAYTIAQEDVRTMIDYIADCGLKLIFSDHAWELMLEQSKYFFWRDLVGYAETKLGDNLIVTWANNSVNALPMLNLDRMVGVSEMYPNAKMGLSDQNWFQTAAMIGMNDLTNEYPESDMPVELTAGFAFRAFERGASLVQFEPAYQFFNYFRNIYVSNALRIGGQFEGYMGDTTAYEHAPDFSPRVELKRFVQYLLKPVDYFNDIENFYDKQLSRLGDNSEADAPTVYTQSTISTYGDTSKTRFYDKYVNNKELWIRQDDYRLGDWFYTPDTIKIERMALTYNDNDSLLSAQMENGKRVGYIHNVRNSMVMRDEEIFADNESGNFVTFTTSNIIKEFVTNTQLDSDEVIVVREKSGLLNFSIYKVKNNGAFDASMPNSHKISFLKINDEMAKVYLLNIFGQINFPLTDFMSINGVRNRNGVYSDHTRPTEGLVISYRSGDNVTVMGKRTAQENYFENEVSVKGEITAITTGDINLDKKQNDELIFLVKDGENSRLAFADFGANFKIREESIDLEGYTCSKLLFFSKSFYQRIK